MQPRVYILHLNRLHKVGYIISTAFLYRDGRDGLASNVYKMNFGIFT